MFSGPQPFPSSINRPVRLRMRPDLIAIPRLVAGETRYVIKDPISLAHHQFWEEEFALLKMLDGKTSMASMKEAFETRFKPARLDISRLEILHGHFHRNGLILSAHLGQGQQLLNRHERDRSQHRKSGVLRLLAMRFRGVNPDAFLTLCERWTRFLFSPATMIVLLLFVLISCWYLASRWSDVVLRLPDWNTLLKPYNLVWMTAAFIGLKAMHELGHGLACKHFGGECNEMGLMLLVFAPCLYCDVSDSWMIESKWRRAFVAAAGVWFEVVIAAICMWLWWFSYPGLLHSMAFNIMVVGSIGTVIFNANPFLRYDGYFVLSDILEAPNLWFQSRIVLEESLRTFFLQLSRNHSMERPERQQVFLWFFALFSTIYRFLLTVSIVVFVYGVFQFLRLDVVGAIFAILILASVFVRPLGALGRVLGDPSSLRYLRKGRVCAFAILLVGVLATVLWLPIPARIAAPVVIQYSDAKQVVNVVAGQLVQVLTEGTEVLTGSEIARLESKSIKLDLLARRGELARQNARRSGLESRRGSDASISRLVPAVEETIDGLLLEVKGLEAEFDQLTLRSPIDGIVMAPKTIELPSSYDGLDYWEGNPLRTENLGCWLETGTIVCQVASKVNQSATIYLSQSQVELVHRGQTAVIKMQQYPDQILEGRIVDVGLLNDPVHSRELRQTILFATSSTPSENLDYTEPIYVASMSISEGRFLPIHGTLGEVSVRIEPQSLATRLLRLFHQTFVIDPTVQGK